jgi:hypothetical protein
VLDIPFLVTALEKGSCGVKKKRRRQRRRVYIPTLPTYSYLVSSF